MIPATTLDTLRASLAQILDEAGFIDGATCGDRYCVDWKGKRGAPLAVLRPATPLAVSATMQVLSRLRQPVVVQGGMTGLVNAGVPQPGEVVLSLERLNRIEEIDPVSGTATVQAGVALETLHEAARRAGLFFPVDIGSRGSCQIGGILSTNAGGNRVLRYGMTRQSVLGLEAVLPDGRVISRMGKVLKDNAGYDLKHLFLGSEGTLGVITRAVLILMPEPTSRDTALVGLKSFPALLALLAECRRRLGARLTSFEVMWHDYFAFVTGPMAIGRDPFGSPHALYALVETMGSDPVRDREILEETLAGFLEAEPGCDAVLANSLSDAASFWRVRDSSGEAVRAVAPVAGFDVSLPIDAMASWVARVHETLRGDGFSGLQTYGHVADGNLHLVVPYAPGFGDAKARIDRLVYESIGALGGSVSAEHGIGFEKKSYLDLSRSPVEIALMRQMKAAIDPQDILNRGRIFDARSSV
jgi:FAD/FMN-containing dehydrogenase